MKTVFKSQTIKDNQLEKAPKFYTSPAGSFKLGRLDRGMEVGSSIFPIAKILQFDFHVTNETSTTHSENHNLNFIPEVLGTYYLTKNNQRRIIGDIPATDYSVTGWVCIEDTTTSVVTVSAFLTMGALIEDDLVFKLYLLDREAV